MIYSDYKVKLFMERYTIYKNWHSINLTNGKGS